ncbi:hypothetical protein [Stenotrophomonas hibiscicola]|uniref:hypothetical protein n=1 Tax=Stenotrophomonas hibiscicola TaxID=86189 RepID=UPI001310D4E9|nr:hypothetical protein [[Pseudomonas] hibiscicola]
MNLHDMAIRLIEKVTWETVQGKLKWRFSSAPSQLTDGKDDKIEVYLQTKFKGQPLALFERRYKYYADIDEWSWTFRRVFAILDGAGRVIYESSDSSLEINNLYDLAFNNAGDVENVMNMLLSDD